MKLSQLVLLAVALSAGVMPAICQAQVSNDEPQATLLGANYRIVITATANGKKAGEVSVLTCSSAIQTEGFLSMPTEENRSGTSVAVQGWLAELEGGPLKLSYAIGMMTPVPSQTIGGIGEARPATTTVSFKRTGATGMLLAKPGQSYDILKITGVVYSISITPTDTWTVERPRQGTKPPAPAGQDKASAAAPAQGKSPPRHVSEDDRKRFQNLSEEAKQKLRSAMEEGREKLISATPEERAALVQKVFDKIEAEDQAKKKPKSP